MIVSVPAEQLRGSFVSNIPGTSRTSNIAVPALKVVRAASLLLLLLLLPTNPQPTGVCCMQPSSRQAMLHTAAGRALLSSSAACQSRSCCSGTATAAAAPLPSSSLSSPDPSLPSAAPAPAAPFCFFLACAQGQKQPTTVQQQVCYRAVPAMQLLPVAALTEHDVGQSHDGQAVKLKR